MSSTPTTIRRITTSPYMMCARVNAYSAIIEVFTDKREETIETWNAMLELRERATA